MQARPFLGALVLLGCAGPRDTEPVDSGTEPDTVPPIPAACSNATGPVVIVGTTGFTDLQLALNAASPGDTLLEQ